MSQLCAHQLFMECLCPLLAKMWVRSYAGESSIGSVQAGMSNLINASFYKMYSMFNIGELLLFGSFLWLQLIIVGPRVCLGRDLGSTEESPGEMGLSRTGFSCQPTRTMEFRLETVARVQR